MLYRHAVQEFLSEQAYRGNSPATLTYYRERLERFGGEAELVALTDFTEHAVRSWLLGKSELSRNSLANYDRALRVFANWLAHRGYVEVSPMARLPKPRAKEVKIVTFSAAEVRTILALAKGRRCPLRNYAMVLTLLDTGIRRGELVSLTLTDIQWRDGWLNVRGKTGERTVPIGSRAKRALRRYIDEERKAAHPGEMQVFLAESGEPLAREPVTRCLNRIVREAGITREKVGPHTFRHTFAVEYLRAGGDVFSLQQILGHTKLDMTMRYVHYAKNDIKHAHSRFSPTDRFLGAA